jgi:HD superfamily phosphohydrolase
LLNTTNRRRKKAMDFAGEITDPVHRYIQISQAEKDLIDLPVFQRLRRIRQLAGAHLVYPSAQHSRFEHSLGAMHIAGCAAEVLLRKGYIGNYEEVQDLRIAALLHDIGHGPFSHLFEEVLESKGKTTHEEVGRRLILETEISDTLEKYGHSPKRICNLTFGRQKIGFLNEVISGALSADIMDYLPRDGLFTGAEYAKIDYHRLVSSLEVHSGRLAISKSALNSLESMLISRYEMFKAVYFHKTVRSAEVMLLESMIAADEELGLSNDSLENYVNLTDEATLERLCTVTNPTALGLARDYRDRRLLKAVYEKIILKRDRHVKVDRDNLHSLSLEIADKARVDPKTIFVDASRAPSMPLTPSKNELRSIIIVENGVAHDIPVADMPLVDSISGFLDMLRVYTKSENREAVERSVKKVLGEQEPRRAGSRQELGQ